MELIHLKKLIAGLVVGLMIGVASTSVASTDAVQAVFAKFAIEINGEQQQLETDPVVIKGTSYLPVREVAGLLGYDVGFADGTITLNDDKGAGNDMATNETVTDTGTEWITFRDLAQKDGIDVEYGYHQGTGNNLIIKKENQTIVVPGVTDYDLSPFEVNGGGTI